MTIPKIKSKAERLHDMCRKELETVLRALEHEPVLPEAVSGLPHDLTDLICLAFNTDGRRISTDDGRATKQAYLAQEIFGGTESKARNKYSAIFGVGGKVLKGGNRYRQIPNSATLRSFLAVTFRVWSGSGSPSKYDPPIDIPKTIEHAVIAYENGNWDDISSLIEVLAGTGSLTLKDLQYLVIHQQAHLRTELDAEELRSLLNIREGK